MLSPSRIPLRDALLVDLRERGVAAIQGPEGAGISTLAAAVARAWGGPVRGVADCRFDGFGDLLAGLHPEIGAAQSLPIDGAIPAALAPLREGGLWVIDGCEGLLPPPPARAQPRDGDLAVLLAALAAGEGLPGAVLFAGRRTPSGLPCALHPIPLLPRAEGEALAGRSLPDDAALLRRPGALALLGRHPRIDTAVPDVADAVVAEAEARLSEAAAEIALLLGCSGLAVSGEALAEVTGLTAAAVGRAVRELLDEGWLIAGDPACLDPALAGPVRRRVPARLPGVLPEALLQRLAGYLLRAPGGRFEWRTLGDALEPRLALRLLCRASGGRMALQAIAHGHTRVALDHLGCLRAIRDDAGLVLRDLPDDAPVGDRARVLLVRGRAQERLGDAALAGHDLQDAVALAEGGESRALECEARLALARRLLLSAAPADARTHLLAATVLADALGDAASASDAWGLLGGVALQGGDADEADACFREAEQRAERVGDSRRASRHRAGLGGVLLQRGRLREAERALVAAADAGLRDGDLAGAVQRLANVALVRNLRLDVRGAAAALAEALSHGEGLAPRSACRLLAARANLRRLVGDIAGAAADLDRAEVLLRAAADREAAVDLQTARGHLLRTCGEYAGAVEAFDEALHALAPGRDGALRALLDIERANAVAWSAADDLRSGSPRAMSALLDAAAAGSDALPAVPRQPLAARRYAAAQQALEAQLLASWAGGTQPFGVLRAAREVLGDALGDSEREPTGEPALRVIVAFGLARCGLADEAHRESVVAAHDAGVAGFQTIRGRALALRDAASPLPDWHGQAKTLRAILFGDRAAEQV